VPDSIRHAANCGNCKFGWHGHVIGDYVLGLCCFHSADQVPMKHGVVITADEYRKRAVAADELCDHWQPYHEVRQ
jgi:hypothetical protein